MDPQSHVSLTFGVMILGGLLSGFKSGLFAVLITGILLAAAAGYTIGQKNIVRIMTAAMISILFGLGVGSMYETYRPQGTVASLQSRILQGSAAGPELVLAAKADELFGPSSVKDDLSYFGAKYFGIGSGDNSFAFQERVSATLTRTPLRTDSFLVPITTTAVADTQYDYGLFLGAVAMFFLGYVLQRAEREASRVVANPYRFLGYAAVLLGGYGYVIHGGLIYTVLNWSVVYVFFVAICAMTRLRQPKIPPSVVPDGERLTPPISKNFPGSRD